MEEELKEIEKIKEIPEEVTKKIHKKIFENIIIAVIIMAIGVIMLMAYKNIVPSRLVEDLKYFSIMALVGTLFVIERAYKKDSGKLAINAVEMIVVSLIVLSLHYWYTYYLLKFPMIIVFIIVLLAAYYAIKSIAIVINEKKIYRKSVNDIKNIVK